MILKFGSFGFRAVLVGLACGLVSPLCFGLENAKVMPVGIRRLTLRTVGTEVSEKTNGSAGRVALAKPLQKDLTFKDVVKGEEDFVKRELTEAFLLTESYEKEEALGKFAADIRSRVNVYAPIFSYGITPKVTLALAVPFYSVSNASSMDFTPSETGKAFLNRLSNNYNNQTQSAREAADKLNNAVGRLNDKLEKNGYKKIQDWSGTGFGDTQLVAKVRTSEMPYLATAVSAGVVIPTGTRDDPDNLLDRSFGDGQWDAFVGGALDQPLPAQFTVNEYVRYTYQMPSRKKMRMVTEDESIEVPKETVFYKLGDKIEAGTSVQYENDAGIVSGAGYNFFHKVKDIYRAGESTRLLTYETMQQMHEAELEIGYSSVPAFRRKEIAIPFEAKLGYKHQLRSRNMPVTNLLQLEASAFF
jgi:hypothetical protein